MDPQLKKVFQANLYIETELIAFIQLTYSLCYYYFCGLPWWAQTVKNLPTVQEIWVGSLGWEDPLKKGMAIHCSSLQNSYLENSMDRGTWWVIVHGVSKSGTRLSDEHYFTYSFFLLLLLSDEGHLFLLSFVRFLTEPTFTLRLSLLGPDQGQALQPSLDHKTAQA